MLRRTLCSLLPLAAGVIALAACDNGSGSSITGPNNGQAAFTVRLTDAPGDLAEAWVRIQKIQLVGGRDSTRTDSLQSLTPKDSGWINLLALTGGKTTDLFSGNIKAGHFSQVRLIVCDMYIKTTDGQIVATSGASLPSGVTATAGSELKLTSQCHSGFKVVLRGDSMSVGADSSGTLTIDFDAKQSFAHEAGKSGKWIVTPVLFGSFTSQGGNGGNAPGSITGNVTLAQSITLPLACGGQSLTVDSLRKAFVPTATKADTVRSGTTTAAGVYTISNLLAGTYTMGVAKLGLANGDSLTYTATATPSSVAVTAGTAAHSDYAVSAVACKAHS